MTLEGLVLSVMVLAGITLLLLVPGLVGMHLLMPQAFLRRYWAPPHFRPTEIALLTNSFWAPLRTAMLLAAIVFPAIARKRQISSTVGLMPEWYRIGAIVLFTAWIAVTTGMLVSILWIAVWLYMFGPSPDGKTTIALLLAAFFFVGAGVYHRHLQRRQLRRRKPRAG